MQQMQLNTRAYDSTQSFKWARTIANLAGLVDIQTLDIAEATQSHGEAWYYRPRRVA